MDAFDGLFLRYCCNQGWEFAGIVEGENKEEAEIRFIVNQGDRFAEQRPIPSNVYKPVALKPSVKKDTMSLFPE